MAVVTARRIPSTAFRHSPKSARTRYMLAWSAGSGFAVAVFLWFVTAGTGDLFAPEIAGNFHDLQARSLLRGEWGVDSEAVSIEGFAIGGRTVLYFGPLPALIRLPVLAVTDVLDGRLARVSLVLAFTVALAASGALAWRVRRLVRADDPLGPVESLLVVAAAGLVGSGSVLVFYASRAWVYHESSLWAIAFALAAFAVLLAYERDRRNRQLLLACLCALAAILSRGSVGLGPAVAIAVLGAVEVVRLVRRRRSPDRSALYTVFGLFGAALVPIAAYSAINLIKFESPFSLPLDRQVVTTSATPDGSVRRAALAANGGSLFGAQYVPTTVLQYVRPDAIRLQRLFPWVRFPSSPAPVGGVTFESIDPSASVPATTPALVVLAAGGLVGIARCRRLRPLFPLLAGAAVGTIPVLAFGSIAHRYSGDLFPLLLVPALTGVTLLPLLREPRWLRGVSVVGVAILTTWSVWVNAALTLDYQRLTSPNADEFGRANLVEWQVALAPRAAFDVQHGTDLGPVGPAGQFFVVGACDGLYRSNGEEWTPVERTPSTGHLRVRASFTKRPPGTVMPLAFLSESGAPASETEGNLHSTPAAPFAPVSLRWLEGGRIVFQTRDLAGVEGRSATIEPGTASYRVDVIADTRTTELGIMLDGDPIVNRLRYQALPQGKLVPAQGWAQTIEHEPTPTPSCNAFIEGSG